MSIPCVSDDNSATSLGSPQLTGQAGGASQAAGRPGSSTGHVGGDTPGLCTGQAYRDRPSSSLAGGDDGSGDAASAQPTGTKDAASAQSPGTKSKFYTNTPMFI